jgi:hypothetical protein
MIDAGNLGEFKLNAAYVYLHRISIGLLEWLKPWSERKS